MFDENEDMIFHAALEGDSVFEGRRRMADHPALAWRRAGLADMTGEADGPPLVCPAAITFQADAMISRLKSVAPDPSVMPENGALLLGERGRLRGLSRRGRVSPNGSCRLLQGADGAIALNLPRPEDWSMLPALFEVNAAPENWDTVACLASVRGVMDLTERAISLGLAAASTEENATPNVVATPGGRVRRRRHPRVLDLSSLWAGPLCGSLLGMLGADVCKVEHNRRPDGGREGNPLFFDLLNSGKTQVSLDFAGDRTQLLDMVADADIIIEASRPRALRRLGIFAEEAVARGAVWISITGHGRQQAERIGFGDDCAVAGGLAHAMLKAWGWPMMAGDAIADPLTGIFAAHAGWSAWRGGRGALIDISMSGVIAKAIGSAPAPSDIGAWQAMMERDDAPYYPLRTPSRSGRQC